LWGGGRETVLGDVNKRIAVGSQPRQKLLKILSKNKLDVVFHIFNPGYVGSGLNSGPHAF
jgi:hypothetical protein